MPNKVVYGQMPDAKPAVQGLLEGFESQMQQAMQQSAQMKMLDLQHRLNKQYEQEQNQQTYQALLNNRVPENQAKAISLMPKELQQIAFKEIVQAPRTEALANFWNQMNGAQSNQPMGTQPMGQPGEQQQVAQPGNMPQGQGLNIPSMAGLSLRDIEKVGPAVQQAQQFRTREQNRENARREQASFNERWRESDRTDKLDKQAKQEARLDDKKTEEFYNDLKSKATVGEKQLRQLQKMQAINDSGELPSSKFVNFMEKFTGTTFGKFINFNNFLGPKGQLYNKTLQEFLTGMQKVFGGKVSVAEMQNWMAKFPRLINTKEGRAEILKDLETWAALDIDKYKVARDIYEKNGYMRPKGYDVEVEKAWEPIQDKYFKQFMSFVGDIPSNVTQSLSANPKKGYRDPETGKRYAMLNGQPTEITESNIAEIKKQYGGQ